MIVRSSNASYLCRRCISRQLRRLYSITSSTKPPPPPPPSGAAKLTNRRLISLQGQDTSKFLQGIVTNNVRPESTSGFYAAFLTAQGKVLHDTFIYPTLGSNWHKQQDEGGKLDSPGYLVEVDAQQAEVLFKHLKRHKLRSKFTMRLLEEGELNVWSLWREEDRWTAHGQPQNTATGAGTISLTDCRAPGMGRRLVLPDNPTDALQDVDETSLAAYTIRRYLRGVPEGQKEMPRDDCLPMNCNMDIMGGIDFKKGCYVGQELTIRTHHTGVVRRRILPVMLLEENSAKPEKLEYDLTFNHVVPDAGTDIRKDDGRKRSTGKFLAGIGNVGLGMCRLEQMTDLTISGEPSPFKLEDRFLIANSDGNQLGLKAFVPDWIRRGIREPKIQKRVE
ncbi:transferase CAF17, mitochondrial [Lecanosticta acicola]|uniref:Iron-sulfur cluster assembly factor IBA57 homolog, mitochondrial n=1 Tax=Lecanosticta acicola TaxID=111012 RepID=A0AAI8YS56_9PEZI|nr:transferase CAF17, mitochondrial [Lecanosticta acicola]